ncbi:hypothetical protein J3459_014738 [Metarhizium acridum]|nr:hypothetical protein J3459_014738 [Metarhizium acridum]
MEKLNDLNLVGDLFIPKGCVSGSRESNNGVGTSIFELNPEAEVKGALKPVNNLSSATV